MGKNCLIMDRVVPLYAKLISLGDNVHIASNVNFVTHDITHSMLNNIDTLVLLRREKKFFEKVGCIEIGDNVFIGSGTRITYNVKIGSNVIIGACSLVNRDIPDNCVVAGVPVKVIKTFDEYLEKRNSENLFSKGIGREVITPDAEKELWDKFYKDKNSKMIL